MAQGHQNAPESIPQGEVGFVFTQAELNKALAARGFRIHEGFAYGEQDGALFRIVAPTSPLAIAHGYAEFLRNRVVSNRNGVSPEAAAIGAANGTSVPNAKSNDAFDSVYWDRIAELTDAKKGWTAEAIKAMSAEQKAERIAIIKSNCASDANKAKFYDATVREAMTAGKSAGEQRVTKRKAGSKHQAEEL
jgi:hypothetical protein